MAMTKKIYSITQGYYNSEFLDMPKVYTKVFTSKAKATKTLKELILCAVNDFYDGSGCPENEIREIADSAFNEGNGYHYELWIGADNYVWNVDEHEVKVG